MELHTAQSLHQHRPPSSSPPAPAVPPISQKPPAEQDLKRRPVLPISFSNGALKKHRTAFPLHPPPGQPPQGVYRECMKNHAAAMGGHALDGCGEFMPSPGSVASEPSSLTCAACGCHRNFHRRVFSGEPHLHYHHNREEREVDDPDEEGDEAVDDDDEGHSTPPPTSSAAAAAAATAMQFYSAPHMLMALSAGLSGGAMGTSSSLPATAGPAPRKRFRTKFSAEQKERMQELSERLGWRMQKRDDAMVEQCCREIGVSRGVFKVWMHNNKHNFVGGPSSRRSAGAPVVPGADGGEPPSTGGANGSAGLNPGAGHVIDSPSSSSEDR